jgi:hypothetical protein
MCHFSNHPFRTIEGNIMIDPEKNFSYNEEKYFYTNTPMTNLLSSLAPKRRMRVLTVGLAASISLLLLTLLIAEPMRSFAATTDSENVIVSVTLASALGLACDGDLDARGVASSGETLNLGTITYTGDTGVYSNARAAKCFVSTNNTTGYTLGWRVATGSGGAFTGHLISQYNRIIAAFGTGSTRNYTKTWELNPTGQTNDSRWGGRVSSTSSGSDVAPMTWGTDGGSEKWARVTTGSTVTIRQSSTLSQGGSGDLIRIGFRAQVGATKVQQTGTYKATVTFTAATQ